MKNARIYLRTKNKRTCADSIRHGVIITPNTISSLVVFICSFLSSSTSLTMEAQVHQPLFQIIKWPHKWVGRVVIVSCLPKIVYGPVLPLLPHEHLTKYLS